MKAPEALKAVFAQAGWELKEEPSEAIVSAKLELANFDVLFCAYNEEELFLSVSLGEMPVDEERRFELLKGAAALCAYLWQRHKINLTVTDNSLNLELIVKTQIEDFLEKISVFLDDCDYFKDNLEAMQAPAAPSSLSAFF